MPTLLVSRAEAKRTLLACAARGTELATKAEVADRTGGYRDWLSLFTTGRQQTIAGLEALYAE